VRRKPQRAVDDASRLGRSQKAASEDVMAKMAIEPAVMGKHGRLGHRRLAVECAKLDPVAEQALADQGVPADAGAWLAY
jgi:hypothetical protein